MRTTGKVRRSISLATLSDSATLMLTFTFDRSGVLSTMPPPVTNPVILDTTPVAEHLRARLPNAEFIDLTPPHFSREELLTILGRTHAILNPSNLVLTSDLLDAAPHLRIVAQVARGYDNIDPIDLARRGIWATNVPDAFTGPTAEVAIGLLLMVARRLEAGASFVRSGEWSTVTPGEWDGFSLRGKTLGIIGYGQIGQAVAKLARAFGMQVVYHQRREVAGTDDRFLPLAELLAVADVVSLHAPLTPETRHFLNADAIQTMKSGAVVINTGRGSLIDESALTDALINGKLGGAGLDVVEDEPRVSERLRLLPNVVITPHLAGSTVESHAAAQELAIANIISVMEGRRPECALNEPDLGRRELASPILR